MDREEKCDYGWPVVRHQGTPMRIMITNARYSVSTLALPAQLVEYLLMGGERSIATWAIDCLQVFEKETECTSIAVGSACICSLGKQATIIDSAKHERSSQMVMQFLHKQGQPFLHSDFHRAERTILAELDFDLLSDGVPHCQVRMVTHCLKRIFESDYIGVFAAIVQDLQKIVWYYIYVGRVKMRQGRDKLLTAALVHLALIFLTQFSGKFLQTLWACQLTGVEEKAVITLSNRLLKEILGEEAGKLYQF